MVYICNQVSPLIRLWIELMLEDWKRDCRPEYHLVKAGTRDKTRAELGVPVSFRKPCAWHSSPSGGGASQSGTKGHACPCGSSSQMGHCGAGWWMVPSSEVVRSSVQGWLGGSRTGKCLLGRWGRPWEGLHRPRIGSMVPSAGCV